MSPATLKVCPFCKKSIQWFAMAPDGRKIPAEENPAGQLMMDALTGWLARAHETRTDKPRYRSHLLDCKKLAFSLHSTKTITIGKDDECSYPGCNFKGKHSHVHCYRCGETGHFAKDCEAEDDSLKELVFE